MPASLSQFPDQETLTVGLASVFKSNGFTGGEVAILDREPNVYATTFPSEIVTCRFADESGLRLFCKYGASDSHNAHGHRGGLAYEVDVYRRVLQPIQDLKPKFYGAHMDPATGNTWLILEYLDDSLPVVETQEQARVMKLAAHWIGQFHAANHARLMNDPMPLLKAYDAEYYLGWIRRTMLFAGNLHQRFPWLTTLGQRVEEFVTPLLTAPPTVIHGEYYPINVLYRDEIVHPVDWESAAVAVGEIDLASLTDGWPAEIVGPCNNEYRRARWPWGAPADFERTLTAAQLYWHFRWLGDRPDWTTHESLLSRFEQLHSVGERLGLI